MPDPSYLRAIPWEVYEPIDGGVRVFYVVPGTSGGPSFELERVEVDDTSAHVTITLYERVTRGASKLAAVHRCVELGLAESLGARRPVDGATGRRAQQLNRTATPESENYRHYFHTQTAQHGCPRWSPATP
jgi:hypothetical protein